MSPHPRTHGFTLLELSVVIVIIALLAAGVVTGKTLIHEAGLRAVLAEQDRYIKATKEFMDRYAALPGDMNNATGIWGDIGVACGTLATTSTKPTATTTCNGDGDGRIAGCSGNLSGCSDVGEAWWVWQHLSNAGLIEGKYTGLAGGSSATTQAKVGLNVPASRYKPGGWTLLHYVNVADQAWLVGDHYGHILLFGGDRGAQSGRYTTQPILYVTDTTLLDLKSDDGLPETGRLRAWNNYWLPTNDAGPTAGAGATSFCVNGANTYYVSNDEKTYVCSIFFILGF